MMLPELQQQTKYRQNDQKKQTSYVTHVMTESDYSDCDISADEQRQKRSYAIIQSEAHTK